MDNTLSKAFSADPASLGKPLDQVNRLDGEASTLEQARIVLEIEAQGIQEISAKLGAGFEQAIEILYNCQGKVIVTGIGKSGHIGRKIAATFASTGTSAFFVHAAELRHGDLGMVGERDVVIVASGTGETQEVIVVLEHLKRRGAKLIAITGNVQSTLGRYSDVALDVSVSREACALNLAPTASTTATLAMGDALAVVMMTKRRFIAEDFARSHPGGSLGKRLITVRDVMRSGMKVPKSGLETSYQAVLAEIDAKKLGFTTVCDKDEKLIGIITDGDLRRSLLKFGTQVFDKKAAEIMTAAPKTISENSLAAEALKIMETFGISDLLITDQNYAPVGLIDLKDLLRAGVV